MFRHTENEFALRAGLIGPTVSQDEAQKEKKERERARKKENALNY